MVKIINDTVDRVSSMEAKTTYDLKRLLYAFLRKGWNGILRWRDSRSSNGVLEGLK